MAFNTLIAGDRYIKPESGNVVPKIPNTAYTAAVGDLVYEVAGGLHDNVAVLSGTNAALGIVESLNNGNGVLSVAEFYPGCTIELPYTGAVAIGDKVAFSTNTHGTALDRTKVLSDPTNGTGMVIAKDANSPHGTGHCVVRY